MKKITCLLLTLLLLLSFNTAVFADTINTTNYKVFQGWSSDWGYWNWGISSSYYGELVTYLTTKIISEHDVLAYIQGPNYDVGVGDYFMTSLTIKADSTKLNTYYDLDSINSDYILPSPIYLYIFGGIEEGTNMSTSKQGNITISLAFQNSDFAAIGSWSNLLSKNF
ncbi:MAG TPA: hypothetical protein PLL98_03820 [Bacillota bacterium]|mgnify:CR=1 FL=1|nr:hypothetical protein [Bacillota bacterium]